jgi:putative FmdB family regulatory protein
MPIYEYTCQDCQANYEIIRSTKDADAPLTCEQCQGVNVKRRISLFNAASSGRVIAGGNGCGSCTGGACSTCGSH